MPLPFSRKSVVLLIQEGKADKNPSLGGIRTNDFLNYAYEARALRCATTQDN